MSDCPSFLIPDFVKETLVLSINEGTLTHTLSFGLVPFKDSTSVLPLKQTLKGSVLKVVEKEISLFLISS